MFFNNFHQDNNYKILGSKRNRLTTLNEYLAMFNDVKNEKAIGEASPSYIYNQKAPQLIKEHLPNVKIIAILRQPTDRAYSNYLHSKRADRENVTSFKEAIALENKRIENNWSPLYHYIEKGYYSVQLKRYFDLFSEKNIKIYLFEDVVKNTKETLKDIFKFLEVDENVEIDTSKKANVSGVYIGVSKATKNMATSITPDEKFIWFLYPIVKNLLTLDKVDEAKSWLFLISENHKNRAALDINFSKALLLLYIKDKDTTTS